jgi:hypothetical protein
VIVGEDDELGGETQCLAVSSERRDMDVPAGP